MTPHETIGGNRTLHEIWLVTRRELVSTMATRGYVLSNVVMLAALSFFLFFQPAGSDGSSIGVAAPAGQSASVVSDLRVGFGTAAVPVDVRSMPDAASAIEAVRAGDLDAVVTVGTDGQLQVTVLHALDADLDAALQDVVRHRATEAVLAANALDPGAVDARVAARGLQVVELEPQNSDEARRLSIGLIACILIYLSLLLYGAGLAQSVVEEKTSRVVEILLSTIRPWQLLMGKVVGAGISGLLQLSLLIGVGLGGAAVSGSLELPESSLVTALWVILWYLLGFLLYATIIAATVSTVSRQEDVASVFQPMVLVMGVPFLTAILLAGDDPESPLFEVLSLLPGFSPIMMPIRVGLGTVPLWQSLLAVAVTGATIAVAALGAGRVYANSVLHSGGRVSVRHAIRGRASVG